MLSMLIRFMNKRGCVRTILRPNPDTGELEKYIKRHYILRMKRFGLYIHQVWASDPDNPHDHPWWNFSVVLSGGYYETGADGQTSWRGPGYFRFRVAELFHRLSIGPHSAGACWSLFGHGKITRDWGFITPDGWIEAKKYGEISNSPVDKHGIDFDIEGWFFPKVVPLTEEWAEQQREAA